MNHHLNTCRLSIAVLLLGVFTQCVWAQEDTASLEDAITSLDRAIQSTESESRTQLIQEAAAELTFVMQREGIESSAGEFALGNAYFISNDLGRSILHYRRGLAIDPTDEAMRENLEHARSFVEPTVPQEESGWDLKQALLIWRGFVGRWTIWYGSIALLGIASMLITASVLSSTRLKLVRSALVCVLLGFAGISLLWLDYSSGTDRKGIVVVMPGTEMYSGPGSGVYTEVYSGALGIGTEGVVREIKGDWVRIELRNTQNGWVPADSLEHIEIGA